MNQSFSQALLHWFDQHGRKGLPWQRSDPYPIWVSEIMLQQTQVTTVIPYYQRFMQRFPDMAALANASQDELLHHWSGLGYYARARNLHKAAKVIRDDYGGRFPDQFHQVLELPGIGRSTAGAILAFSTGQRHVILDGNVKRVLCRYHAIEGWPGQRPIEQLLWQLAEQHTPQQRVADYTQAIMDLGATCCSRSRPDCAACPLAAGCRAAALGNPKDYPTPKPRKQLPVRQTVMLLLRNQQGELLLQQRPPSGIWGGLWSLPELAPGDDPIAKTAEQFGLKTALQQQGEIMRHTFSHFHLDIQPLMLQVTGPAGQTVMDRDKIVWYNTQLYEERGLPAPVQKLLRQATAND